MLRVLYQRLKKYGGLPELIPRALQADEIVAGRSEFAVASSQDEDAGGWDGDELLLPRIYRGYVALHYKASLEQRKTFPDEARLAAVLTGFGRDPRVQASAGFRGFGTAPARWFFNDLPVTQAKPLVLTLSLDWQMQVELRIPPDLLGADEP